MLSTMPVPSVLSNNNNQQENEKEIDITQLIRLKERELHEINDLRCNKLEIIINQRDNNIKDLNNKFNKLKDDFIYNLTLLEARDKELLRIENEFNIINNNNSNILNENKILINKLNILELRDNERIKKYNIEKLNYKTILNDMKEALENMKWSNNEDIKIKTNDIIQLKNDIKILIQSRDEALDTQRNDLTNTFENLYQTREKSYYDKEQGISIQITKLNEKHSKLITEINKYKNLIQISQRNKEQAEGMCS
jgi:hypothetical protein